MLKQLPRISLIVSLLTIIINFNPNIALAGDPFRTTKTRNIGDKTEAAFEALFRQGNYLEAKQYLIEAEITENNEPLLFAMKASLAYTEEDWPNLQIYIDKTLTNAKNLQNLDPVRGNLYLAVGYFLQGAYIYQKENPLKAISNLQKVMDYLDAAEKSDPDDPELNLIKGYLDLFLSVNLPFSNPQQAIDNLESKASPNYLVYRGMAVAYRDLSNYEQALKYVNQAIALTPDNPELYYLKGQIIRKQGRQDKSLLLLKESLEYFDKALQKEQQLPKFITKSLRREKEKTEQQITELTLVEAK